MYHSWASSTTGLQRHLTLRGSTRLPSAETTSGSADQELNDPSIEANARYAFEEVARGTSPEVQMEVEVLIRLPEASSPSPCLSRNRQGQTRQAHRLDSLTGADQQGVLAATKHHHRGTTLGERRQYQCFSMAKP